MKKILFGIFAHPDDEAFGPCGTLIKEVGEGTELHLITLTSGEAGQNPDNVADLGAVRDEEWRSAASLIGAFGIYNLHLKDSRLNNLTMQLASERINKIVKDTITSHVIPVEASFITFEPKGLTGHIDHIVAARAATLVFHRLKESGLPLATIRYYCICEDIAPHHDTSWIYADKGYAAHEVDEIIDARTFAGQIKAVMRAHVTQRADCERYQAMQGASLGLDHFIVRS